MAWTREQIAERAVRELKPDTYVNLGIGIPTLMANFPLPEGVMLQNENGMLGMGPYPYEDEVDPDIISPSKQTITEVAGTSYFSAADSFAMIRGGHIDQTFIGGMQVSERGDLANWAIPGKLIKGMGGAMDLAAAAKQVIVLMEHTAKGESRLVKTCSLPLTGCEVVHKVITDLGVFQITDLGFSMEEMAPGVTFDEIKSKSGAFIL